MNDRISMVLEYKGRDVEVATPYTRVLDAVEHMNDRRVGSLVVLDDHRIVGIFTERDVLVRVVSRGLDPRSTLVGTVMTGDPITVRSDATIANALETITVQRCRHLPVVDAAGLEGLVSIGDLTSWMVRDQQRTIHDLHDYIRAA